MAGAVSERGHSSAFEDWGDLPPDLATLVGKSLLGIGGTLEGLLGASRDWREAVVHLVTHLRPLGQPAVLSAFPNAGSIDYGARGHSHTLTDDELIATCRALGPRLEALAARGAFQLTAAGVQSLVCCPRLGSLALDEATLQDADLEPLGQLPQLVRLSLRRCVYLRGGFLRALAPAPTPAPAGGAACTLRSLDVAGCGLSLHLDPEAREALGALSGLTRLDLSGGNGVTDDVARQLARLPCLGCLLLRGAGELTDAGLEALAQAPCAATLHTLDLSGCTRLSEQCWFPLARLARLHSLKLDALPHLLCHGPPPEAFSSALWRWQHLARLSLAGACTHPVKLKLIAATCGATLAHLDISHRPAEAGAAGGSHQPAAVDLVAAAEEAAAAGGAQAPVPAWADPNLLGLPGGGAAARRLQGRGCYARLTPRQLQDLSDALGGLKSLRSFSAAGSCLPPEAALAVMQAATALTCLDLSGCSAEPRQPDSPPRPAWHAFAAPTAAQLLQQVPAAAQLEAPPAPRSPRSPRELMARALGFRLGMPGNAQQPRPAAMGATSSSAQASAPSPSRAAAAVDVGGGAGAADDAAGLAHRFAEALGGLGSLAALNLSGCAGLGDAHVSSLGRLRSLRHLSLADCRGVTDASLRVRGAPAGQGRQEGPRQAAPCVAPVPARAALRGLQTLDLSGTSVTDEGLQALQGLPQLNTLGLARCSVSAEGLAASLAGSRSFRGGGEGGIACSMGASLRGLDLSRCCDVDDAALRVVAARCTGLRWLRLSGCGDVGPAGLEVVARSLPRLTRLEAARCPRAVTDASLAAICQHLTLLTHLDVAGSDGLTTAGLEALAGLRCLAYLDLTCCRGVRDEEAQALLPRLTRANVQMAGGARSPTGSPIKQCRQRAV